MKNLLMMISISWLLVLSACMSEKVLEQEQIEYPVEEQTDEQVEEIEDESYQDTEEQIEEVEEEQTEEVSVLTEEEAVQFVIGVEKKAVEILSNSFEMGEEELVFQDTFEELTSQLAEVYSTNMIEGKFKQIYEKPRRFFEPIHEFPLAQPIVPENQVVIYSEEEMVVYTQPVVNGEENYIYQYVLAVEDHKWKIKDEKKYLSPIGAETAVRHVSKLHDSEINVVFDGPQHLEDHINMLEAEDSFLVHVYVLNEQNVSITLGWYTVDPVTRIVYELNLLENEYEEIGTY
ncbi:hypothetical protein [Halalkalibacter akibai]|uniref:Lipoprotein n=1 Tax=Halalkalibacter akibai (strain ATCC 43226 / DSM 21942 / CIP 109018 / JCM 9157 / 1139) TaxID=1236973 RepID=W4QVW9_HALA3|nr:hypothetical protein [Halalkalibacter akibai]GAE35783.1 hypothetical protein JCM9157_2919 [Halalkalibacter akibai JCM 9157]